MNKVRVLWPKPVQNIYKYNKIYSGAEPTFVEGDVFKTVIPLLPNSGDQASDQASDQVSDQVDRTTEILEFCKTARTRNEIQELLGIKSKKLDIMSQENMRKLLFSK